MDEQLQKKVNSAIKLIQAASEMARNNGCPEIEVAYSGGKDSDVILELTRMAGVPYRAIYKNTTIDPPGTIRHARENGAEIRQPPKRTFLQLIAKSGFPTRHFRFCCEYLKEYKILDYCILGIRSEESTRRKERYKEPEMCRVYSKKVKQRQYFPILHWTSKDVLDFIQWRGIKLHPLYYDENGNIEISRRLGCLGCPLPKLKIRLSQFKDHPNLVKLYIIGGRQFLDSHKDGKAAQMFSNAYEMFCCDVFCDHNIVKFREKFGKTLFDDGIDCKTFLEDYFHIAFNDKTHDK